MRSRYARTTSLLLSAVLLTGGLAACSSAGTTDTSAEASTSSDAPTVADVSADTTAAEVLAANADVHEGDLTYDESAVRSISLDGGSASSEAEGVTISGTTITITQAGTYRLSGTLTDGQVVVDSADEAAVQLILDGVDITSSTTSALAVMDADEAVVILADGTTNTLVDATEYQYPDADTDEPNAALYSAADLTIGGTGTLSVTGRANDGITSKDGLVIAGGTISVQAVDDGVRGKDYVVIDHGSVTVEAGGDGLKSDNDEDETKGFIELAGGTVTVNAQDDAATAVTDLVMTGGTLAATSGGGASAANADSGAKGLVAGVYQVLTGGQLTVDAADDALHSDGAITIADGTTTLAAGDDGVHAESSLLVSGGALTISTSNEGLEAADITLAGGDLQVTASDDGINAAGGTASGEVSTGSTDAGSGDVPGAGQGGPPGGTGMGGPGGGGGMGGGPGGETVGDYSVVVSGGTIVVNAGGDGLDSNGTATMTGGTLVVHGPTNDGNGAIDVNGELTISGGTLLAAGSAGMAETPEAGSDQAWIAARLTSVVPAGTVLAVVADGEVVATFTTTKQVASVVFSSADLVAGQSYQIVAGATATGDAIGGMTTSGSAGSATQVGTATAS